MPRTLEHDPRDDAQPELELFDDEDAPAARRGGYKHADADADEGELAASVSRWLARDPRDPEEEALEDADLLEPRDLDELEADLDDDEPYDAYETRDDGPDA